ncbi:hypothetical protein FBY35_6770 [Streptomyces sp. SLBN-118]|uniref:hypothetical protein n=1 Tax=Streptomyces sp. SLBN-118 TaxID=2768454 RepID=UPI001168FA6C|nr:hypothetical protein [Streptomyces sp. SLBN-118]TQK45217.1 hypothetical protein FBY35_6770 [Streptomyces sp. SLBN-118]
MAEASRIQIHSVEESNEAGGICIARCVGGVARVGQAFAVEGDSQTNRPELRVTLDQIERYTGVFVEFFDPPHAARIYLSGESVGALSRGSIVVSSASGTHVSQ